MQQPEAALAPQTVCVLVHKCARVLQKIDAPPTAPYQFLETLHGEFQDQSNKITIRSYVSRKVQFS